MWSFLPLTHARSVSGEWGTSARRERKKKWSPIEEQKGIFLDIWCCFWGIRGHVSWSGYEDSFRSDTHPFREGIDWEISSAIRAREASTAGGSNLACVELWKVQCDGRPVPNRGSSGLSTRILSTETPLTPFVKSRLVTTHASLDNIARLRGLQFPIVTVHGPPTRTQSTNLLHVGMSVLCTPVI